MIELKVNGSYNIDLPDDIEISIVIENPLFMEDRIPAPYSLDFEVPATPANLAAFGYPTRVTSKIVKRKVPAELKCFGLIYGRGVLLLLESQKQIKIQFKGSLEHENVDKNINQLDLGVYDYGEVPNFYHLDVSVPNHARVNYYSAPYFAYRTAMRSEAISGQDFVIAPVKIKEEDKWFGLESGNGMLNSFYQYINYWNPTLMQFGFEENLTNSHTPILPYSYLWKIIETGFGGQLQSNPFASGDLRKLVLIAENHKNYLSKILYYLWFQQSIQRESLLPLIEEYNDNPTENLNEHLQIILKSFMQSYPFKTLLKNILKIFCMTAYPGHKYSLEFNNDILNRTTVNNIDDKLTDELLISFREGMDYVFSYSVHGESDVKQDGFMDMVRINASLVYQAALFLTPDKAELIKDSNTGAIYNCTLELKGLNSEKRIKSEVARSALAITKRSHSRGVFDMSSDIAPLDLNFHHSWSVNYNTGDIIPMKHWFVPEIDKKDVDAAPNIMFFGGMADNFDHSGQYPYLMAHHTDHFGVQRLNTSLHPEGTDGLIEKFHGKYKEWIEKDKVTAKGSFKLTPLEIRNLDIRDKFYVRGQLFYIEKLEYSITHKRVSLVDMELVEI